MLIMSVDIVDIGSGNIRSIQNWLERLHVPTNIVKSPTEIKSNFLVLPGVGSAGSYMQRMIESGFDQAVIDHVDSGRRILGICLGFQIMAEFSQEDGGTKGLGILKGKVEKLNSNISHNSWEKFEFYRSDLTNQKFNSERKLTRKQKIAGRVFFNHEYGFINNDPLAFSKPISIEYNQYSSMVVKDNIIGIQFHPEKSQLSGLELISMIL